MQLIHALLFSVVEGITEFLPVSSTGHLILASNLLKIPQTEFMKSFEIIIQFGAILAVLVLYFKKLIIDIDIWKKIILAFLPSTIFGVIFYGFIKQYLFENTLVVILSLLIGGIFMILFEKYYPVKQKSGLNNFDYLKIGLFQVLSMIPGVSRAMATIFGGMIVGLNRKQATEFSFLLAIPTMLGATVLDLYKTDLSIWTNFEAFLLIIGFIASFITAFFTVKFLIMFVQSKNFIIFGIYRILLAVFLLVYFSALG